jgi:hypothetical protein
VLPSERDGVEFVANYGARPVAIDDRTILAVLDALLDVQVKAGRSTVTQRVSYKALDVEQIGHCYEGLLDHGCAPIEVLSLGLIGPEADEPEVTVADLERHLGQGRDVLCEVLSAKTMCNKKASALSQLLEKQPSGVDLARLRSACGHDDSVVERVLPFWGLIRRDLRGLPVVLLPGSQFVTQLSTRSDMGAQYTTRTLAEEVACNALEPLVYEPGPQNESDPKKWVIRPPDEILNLKICDPAVGSGAILTAGGRFLADALLKAVDEHGPGQGLFATRLIELANAAEDEQVLLARREVVDRCLYGVDKNPVAAEMAKLSLWLTTMAKERPFTFLDHAIQVGDSLLGVTDVEQIRWLHVLPVERHGARGFEGLAVDIKLARAVEIAQQIQALSVVTLRDVALKRELHHELERELSTLSVVADAVVGAAIRSEAKGAPSFPEVLAPQIDRIEKLLNPDESAIESKAREAVLRDISSDWLRTDLPPDLTSTWERHCFHWPLRFPEVFLDREHSGFDAIIGNPPFLGGVKTARILGISYESLLKTFNSDATGFVDLVAFFFDRVRSLIGPHGAMSMIGPEYLTRDVNRDAGLDRLTKNGWNIVRATSNMAWPGEAKVFICLVAASRAEWNGPIILDGCEVERISPSLTSSDREIDFSEACRLQNLISQTEGIKLYGASFLRSETEWNEILTQYPDLQTFLRVYVNGDFLCADPNTYEAQMVVDFGSKDKHQLPKAILPFVDELEAAVAIERSGQTRQIHESRNWLFWDKREKSMARARELDRVIAFPARSKYMAGTFIDPQVCPSHGVKIFMSDAIEIFGLMASNVFVSWVTATGGARPTGFSFSIRSSYDTFVFPSEFTPELTQASEEVWRLRTKFRDEMNYGLTSTLNLMNDMSDQTSEALQIRNAQQQLEDEVLRCYGWQDVDSTLGHSDTRHGTRFVFDADVESELLYRLLVLNQDRYAAEQSHKVEQRIGKKSNARSSVSDSNQGTLI